MKTEGVHSGDPVWTQNVELLTQEECLPVIGSTHVSSILQHLDPSVSENGTQNMDLIILPSADFKIPAVGTPFSLSNNYIILRENGETKPDKSKTIFEKPKDNLKTKKENFEDMLYFVCNLCPFLCTNDAKITEHLENAHKNKTVVKLPQLKCPACANIFYHRMSLRSHLIHDHGVGNSDLTLIIQAIVYYSNKNKKKEKQKSQIKNIVASEHNSLQNSNSEIVASDNNVMKQDLKKVDLSQVNAQYNAKTMFDSLTKLIDVTPVTNVDSEKCKCPHPNCKVKFLNAEKLAYHLSCHVDMGFACFDCGEKFCSWRPLSSHIWRVHKVDLGLYSCDKCDYKTYSLAKLNNIHKFIHSDAKNFSCNQCSKAFKNNKQLRNHKLIHKDKSEKLTHTCEECSKAFADKRQLRIHMDVVHKKLKPFLCNFCGYKGSSRSSLKMHTRQHTGEKPFSCSACSYTTSDHNSLRRHKLRHTGQKPYKCSYCSYACIQSSTYKTHLKTKHPGMEKDLMFTCLACQFRSVNKDMYTSHMATVHNLKPHYLELQT